MGRAVRMAECTCYHSQAHRAAAWGSPAKRRVTALIDLRNLVAAPLSEEFVFRGCMLPLLLLEVRRTQQYADPLLGLPHLASPVYYQTI